MVYMTTPLRRRVSGRDRSSKMQRALIIGTIPNSRFKERLQPNHWRNRTSSMFSQREQIDFAWVEQGGPFVCALLCSSGRSSPRTSRECLEIDFLPMVFDVRLVRSTRILRSVPWRWQNATHRVQIPECVPNGDNQGQRNAVTTAAHQ